MGAEKATIGSWESEPEDAAKHPASHKTAFQKEKKHPIQRANCGAIKESHVQELSIGGFFVFYCKFSSILTV